MVTHNHFTRDIKSKGECPACDLSYDRDPGDETDDETDDNDNDE